MANRIQLGRLYHLVLPLRDIFDVAAEMAEDYRVSEESQTLLREASKVVQRAVNTCRHEYWQYDCIEEDNK